MFDFSGKKMFITGGASGIGKEIAESFEKKGAIVVKPTIEELDLSNGEMVSSYTNKPFDFDIMVFCAGINKKSIVENLTMSNLEETFQVNVFSSIKLLQNNLQYMKQNGGKIVFISSLYSLISKEERLSYSASKSSLNGVIRTLTLELAKYNICINAVSPGYVMTEMTLKNLTKEDIENIKDKTPTRRLQKTTEIANLVEFLCSDLNESITGQNIAVDGGFLCQ